MSGVLYFDYNATHPHTEAVKAAFSEMADFFGNPSSAHAVGRRSRSLIEETRELLAAHLGVSHRELFFCSGGTEANHIALLGMAMNHDFMRDRQLLYTPVEHPSVLGAVEILKTRGVKTVPIPVSADGLPDLDFITDKIRETALLTCMVVNNETGLLMPCAEIAAVCRENGVFFHSDWVQGLGKMDFTPLPSSASFSGHKLGAAKGIGVLYCGDKQLPLPLFKGGSQEKSLRPGTENLWGIISLRAALRELDVFRRNCHDTVRNLRDRFENSLMEKFPFACINASGQSRVANTSSVTFGGIDGESLFFQLDMRGICVSMGSACSSGGIEPSHVLLAMGRSREEARSTIRFSFGRFNTELEIDKLVNVLCEIVSGLQNRKRRRK